MKLMSTLLSLALVTGAGLAGGGGIAGQVLDAVTGTPVVGALVVARSEGGQSRQARTNERGAYALDDLRPGNYRVRAGGARGYEPAEFPRPVPVRADELTAGIDFRLRRVENPDPGAIAGRIVDRRTGQPVANARVMAFGRPGRRAAHTDERGRYLVRDLRPGSYRVVAGARGYLRADFARPVDVRPGQQVDDVDFALVPRPRRGGIAGQVVDARTHRPIAGAVINARGEHGAERAVTDRQGNYRLRLNPGRYRVSATARGYRPETFPRPVPVHPHEVTRDVDFALHGATADSD
jgi:protocatechuate 3,4-dioxygenase beta subunit